MEAAGNGFNIVILDACRNNPFTRSLGSRGLARMDGPAGTFIAYATGPGAVSQDGGAGRNSPAADLLEALNTPGLSPGAGVQAGAGGRRAGYWRQSDSVGSVLAAR